MRITKKNCTNHVFLCNRLRKNGGEKHNINRIIPMQ